MSDRLGNIVLDSCERCPEKTFMTFSSEEGVITQVNYRQFAEEVQRWAEFLVSKGVGGGSRVGIVTPKSPQQIRAFYACWWIGAIAVPVCESLGDLEMGFVIRDSEPCLILVDDSMSGKVAANCGDVPVVQFEDVPSSEASAPVPLADGSDADVAALIYTSGSTGMPKGVMLTHRNFAANARSILELVEILPDDSIVSLLPYWHSFALIVEVVTVAMAGAEVIVPRDKRDFQRNIGRYRPSIILLVPRIADALKRGIEKRLAEAPPRVRQLFEKAIHNASRIFTAGPRIDGGLVRMAAHHAFYDPFVFKQVRKRFGGRLRFFISGGAPLDLEHQIFFKYVGVPIYQGYGLTESSPVISCNIPEKHRLGSSGTLLSWLAPEKGGGVMFRDDTGATGRHLRGELLVKGACVMKGYWRHSDASAKTLADGWLHTGDMGYLDDDGYLFLEGRQGNMIVLFGGEKLHPEHVEDAVKGCDSVTDAMVIGEGCKNVYVCVNVDKDRIEGLSDDQSLARVRAEMAEHVGHLAAYQKPKDVLILPDFSIEDGTLTVTLKVRRHKVWAKYGDQIRAFLSASGEVVATRESVEIASSRIMESLGRE